MFTGVESGENQFQPHVTVGLHVTKTLDDFKSHLCSGFSGILFQTVTAYFTCLCKGGEVNTEYSWH